MSATTTLPLPTRPRRRADVSVARALGSDTRAGIYDHLREAGAPRTVRDVAARFELHPNVARTHLELLADAGLVTVGRRKHAGGGRPAKVYTATQEMPVATTAPAVAEPGAPLLVRLLLVLLEAPVSPSRGRAGGRAQLATRAHEVAATEGRRLVTALSRSDREAAAGVAADAPGDADLTIAVERALAALRAHAPLAAIAAAGQDWVDVAGIRGLFALAERVRPEVAEALERGLLTGAVAASGVRVSIGEAGAGAAGAPVVRVRATSPPGGLHAITPAGAVDTRGRPREDGVVEAMRAMAGLQVGDVLEVIAEGPGSPALFARWADRAGHELLAVERAVDDDGRPGIRLLIRSGASSR